MARTARFLTALIVVLATVATGVAPAGALVRAPSMARYRVHLTSDRQGHTWEGSESITFTNTSNTTMGKVWLRLWSNGVMGCRLHAITVSQVKGGTPGAPRLECTALPVRLHTPLLPNHRTTISMHVRIKLFHRNDRFGFDGGAVFLGTALPTLAIHDDHGWNLNRFVDLGESFYSVSSDYRVTLDTPVHLETPTTGTLASTTVVGNRTQRTYVASQVRDFEWAAAPFRELAGQTDGVDVRIWFVPGKVDIAQARSARSVAVTAMRTFTRAFGRYPYPEVDVVIAPFQGGGGMEYPNFILSAPQSKTISHELAHQWFYGLVGNDQFRDPWLDESFATWSAHLPFEPSPSCPSYHWANQKVRMDSSMVYFRRVPEAYRDAYFAGACMLSQLSDRFGAKPFLQLLQGYVAQHRFGIVRTGDFKHAVARAARTQLPGFDLEAFWHLWRLDRPG